MKILVDVHTHTIASGHAYSTITENMQAASRKGIQLVAMTDHTPGIPGSTQRYFFDNLRILFQIVSETKAACERRDLHSVLRDLTVYIKRGRLTFHISAQG